MTKWFGESWGAPVCEPEEHVATPVGNTCGGHQHLHGPQRTETIEPEDQGVMIPYLNPQPDWVVYHLDCWFHEIGVDGLKNM